MPHYKRRASETDLYHVFARGTGFRMIFEDDEDRLEFLRRLKKSLESTSGSLYAWCIMGNHFHLIVKMSLDDLSAFMKRLNGGYARFFNERHGRVGHLFEGRYGSEPIKTESQLLSAVRYVHQNPIKPGLSKTCIYPWSSYREYTEIPHITTTELILDMCGGPIPFAEFHAVENDDRFLDTPDESNAERQLRLTRNEALALAKSLLGESKFEELPALPRPDRDESLRMLHQAGLSIRQIELVTGVGKGIVQRAVTCADK